MRKNLTVKCHLILVLALTLGTAAACVVQERKVELQGSTPATPTPPASSQQPTIAAEVTAAVGRRGQNAGRAGATRVRGGDAQA